MGRLKIEFGDASRAVRTSLRLGMGWVSQSYNGFALLQPGRRPAAVCPGQHGRGGRDVSRADGRHPEAVGRPRGADMLRPVTGVSAQRLSILVRSVYSEYL